MFPTGGRAAAHAADRRWDDRKNMTHYASEWKESLIARMLPPHQVSVAELARETGIPKDTLYTWRIKATRGDATATTAAVPGELSSEEKFAAVLETESLNEAEVSAWCRNKGLFPHQLVAWRSICAQAHAPATSPALRKQQRAQSKQIKRLEAELRRKEKALAEAAALLILQKKVRTLWEDPEEEGSTPGSASR